jgi:hypothetical protein
MKNIIILLALFIVQFSNAQVNPHFGLGIDYGVEQETKPAIIVGIDYKLLRAHIGVFPNFYKLGIGMQKGYCVFDVHQKYFVTNKEITVNWSNIIYKHKSFVTGVTAGGRYIFKDKLEVNLNFGLDWIWKSQKANTNVTFSLLFHIKPHEFK